jgi:hypothetical protein
MREEDSHQSHVSLVVDNVKDKSNSKLPGISGEAISAFSLLTIKLFLSFSLMITEIVFMTSIAGASILAGFGMTLAMAKKRDPIFFAKGFLSSPSNSAVKAGNRSVNQELHESGSRLAIKALGWGTLYAVSGFSLFSLAVWKLMSVQNVSLHLDF